MTRQVEIAAAQRSAMAELITVHHTPVVRQTLRQVTHEWLVEAFLDDEAIARLRQAGYRVVEVRESRGARPGGRTAEGRVQVGPGSGPEGYLSVDEVDARIAALAKAHPTWAALITTPHQTWEGRRCRVLRIGTDPDAPGICLLGGVHAREWGSADILVAFAERLLTAAAAGRGISIGRLRITAATVQRIVDGLNIYVFAQVNPDGRHHSMTIDPMWRKNRRPSADGDGSIGVDLNRNFDFLWHYPTHFAATAPIASDLNPLAETFIGPAACSEPETSNVVWLLDHHPTIGVLMDLHSYGEYIMYSWGDDENQTSHPEMSFVNTAFDGKRGEVGDDYREYLSVTDQDLLATLATTMRQGISKSRGRLYTVQQSMNLYPTSGTSDDYAFSRHLANADASKILGFTVEWGSNRNATPFHPAYAEMDQIIREITAGLLAFCKHVATLTTTR